MTKNKQFENHWDQYNLESLPDVKLEIADKFLKPIFENYPNYKSVQILDAGCGDGVHNFYLSKQLNKIEGSHYFGIDISLNALKIADKRTNHNSNFLFARADIAQLPIPNKFFDIVFSYGVIAYTNDPEHSFEELCRITKPGGLIGVWIYPQMKGFQGFVFSLVRKVCSLFGLWGTHLIANAIVPFLGILPTNSKINLKNASWKQCREIVMVNLAPHQLYFPEPIDIQNWFLKNDIEILSDDDKMPICIWGRKC